MADRDHLHDVIWLQPWCDGCDKYSSSGEGRMWCQNDEWGQCDGCERRAVKYVLAKGTPQVSVEAKHD